MAIPFIVDCHHPIAKSVPAIYFSFKSINYAKPMFLATGIPSCRNDSCFLRKREIAEK